jgi:hypothetical protein
VISQADEEFVNRIRRQFSNRRRTGALLVGFGALFVAGALWTASYFEAEVLRLVSQLDLKRGSVLSDAADTLAFALGFKFGATTVGIGLAGVAACVHGLYLLLGARKERLLLQYHDQIEGLTDEKRA